MGWDFWNNPLVVSALRVKYRRGGLFGPLSAYVLILAFGGALLEYYGHYWQGFWPRDYFIALMTLQVFVSAGGAFNATSISMRSEVNQRTWDFQRLTALTPRQILVGKLLGEPIMAYLLAMATVPLAFVCWLGGGVSTSAFILLYVGLACTTFLAATVGLLSVRWEPSKKSRQSQGIHWGLWAIFAMGGLPLLLGVRIVAAGIVQSGLMQVTLPFFNIHIPGLVALPTLEIAASTIIFESMVRQVTNPLNPPLGKGMAYTILLMVDVVTAGVLVGVAPTYAISTGKLCVAFCLAHVLVSLVLTMALTPDRELLLTWFWRFRRCKLRWWQIWLAPRSDNNWALITVVTQGAGALAALIAVQGALLPEFNFDRDTWGTVLAASAVSSLLVLSMGTYIQWSAFAGGRKGAGFLVLLLLFAIVLPAVFGAAYDDRQIFRFSPVYPYVRWFSPLGCTISDVLPTVIIYGILFLGARLVFHFNITAATRRIDGKLRSMGALPPSG